MRANNRYTVRVQEPRVVADRNHYTVKYTPGYGYDLYVFGVYVAPFDRLHDAETEGDRLVFEALRRAA